MAVKEILKIGNDTLRKTSHPVEKFNLRLWLLLPPPHPLPLPSPPLPRPVWS